MARWWVRYAVALLGWGICAASAVAAARPDWYPSDEVIAQQQARKDKEREAALAYYQREILDSYERVGWHDDRWDEAMRRVLDANVEFRIAPSRDTNHKRMAEVNRAVAVQCQDALYAYLWSLTYSLTAAPPQDVRMRMAKAAGRLVKSEYGPLLRFYGMVRLAQTQAWSLPGDRDKPAVAKAQANLTKALALLDKAASTKDMPVCEMQVILETAQEGSLGVYQDRWQWTQQVYDVLVKHYGEVAALQACKGNLYVSYAWDARGTGFANTVTEEGRRLMKQRLELAEKELTAAWDKDHNCVAAASGMLAVGKGQGKDRQFMDTWFHRAVAADAAGAEAYEQMRDYLAPKWHGSEAEMLEFAREVARTVPKASPLRLIVWDAHVQILWISPQSPTAMLAARLRDQPELWDEMKPIADEVCLAKGAPVYDRVRMAQLAVAAEDAKAARSYIAGLDNTAADTVMGDEYARMKRMMAQIESRPPRQPEEKVTFP